MSKSRVAVLMACAMALPIVVILALVPSIGARAQNIDKIPAAVVNLDKPIVDGEQPMAAGRVIAGKLTQPDRPKDVGLDWSLADEKTAKKGLDNGTYYAILTLPKDFSANVLSISGDDPQVTTLGIVTNDATSSLAGAVGQEVGAAAAAEFGSQVTNQFITTAVGQISDLKPQLKELKKGSDQLNEGAQSLAKGTSDFRTGTGQLSDGAQQAASGIGQLSSGAARLNDGVGAASGAISQLAAGARQLGPVVRDQLAPGASQLATGADALAGGIGALGAQTPDLNAAAQVSLAATRGVGAALQGDGTAANPGLASGSQYVSGELAGLVAECDALGSAAPANCTTLRALAPAAASVSAGVGQVNQNVNVAIATPGGSAPYSMIGLTSQLAQGTAALDAAVNGGNPATGQSSLVAGSSGLAAAAHQVSGGVAGVNVALNGDGSRANPGLAGGLGQLNSQSGALTAGSGQLAAGLRIADSSTPTLVNGASALKDGAVQLDGGAQQLAQGTKELSTEVGKGVQKLPDLSDQKVKSLARTVTTPVATASKVSRDVSGVSQATPLVLALALWFGGFAAYLARRPYPKISSISSASPIRIALVGLIPGLVVGLVSAAVLAIALPLLSVAVLSWPALLAALIAGFVCFAAVNQTLRAVFGRVGQIVALAFLFVQLASVDGGLPLAGGPSIFSGLHSWTPLPVLVDGFASAVNGAGTGSVANAVLIAGIWTVASFIFAIAWASKRAKRGTSAVLPLTSNA